MTWLAQVAQKVARTGLSEREREGGGGGGLTTEERAADREGEIEREAGTDVERETCCEEEMGTGVQSRE
jgi:hypothetical protein